MAQEPRRPVRTAAAKNRRASAEEIGKRETQTKYERKGETLEENTQTEKLGAVQFGEGVEPAFLRVGVGNTFNLGSYESLRIDVSVTLPCHPDNLEETYQRASDWVADKMEEETNQWLPQAGGKKAGGR